MRKVFKGFSLLLLILILIFLYFPSISKFFRLKHQEELLNHDIADLKTKIAELRNEARLIKTDVAHLEQVMRRELGLVKPGEVVYKLVPAEGEPLSAGPTPGGVRQGQPREAKIENPEKSSEQPSSGEKTTPPH